jgi:putative membrane protein
LTTRRGWTELGSVAPQRGNLMVVRVVFIAFVMLWVALAIAPVSRSDWMLENVMTLVGVGLLVAFWRAGRLTQTSVILALAFLALHAIGAHYTYSLVPYDDWSRSLFGRSITDITGAPRNEYDRLVHFSFGLLLAIPCHEWLVRSGRASNRAAWWVTLLLAMSASHIYELIEWGAAEMFGGELGAAYVGTQGDEWDAQKDMALATLGTFVGVLIGIAFGPPRDTEGSDPSVSA